MHFVIIYFDIQVYLLGIEMQFPFDFKRNIIDTQMYCAKPRYEKKDTHTHAQ